MIQRSSVHTTTYGLDLGNTTAKTETTQATAQSPVQAETKSVR